MKIQEVKSPGGITAWLVEEHSVPLIALRFAFDGGSAQDPDGKEGVANFLSGMLDEGAGDLTSKQFQERMESIAMRMSFDDSRDAFYGSFETLTENRDKAVALLALAVNKPRFDADAVERVRGSCWRASPTPRAIPTRVAAEQWTAMAFPGHPYGRPANGTPASVQKIAATTSGQFWSRTFARDTLRVVVVGDIDAKTLARDARQGVRQLPAKAQLTPVAATHADVSREAEGHRDGRAAVGRALRPARHAAQGQGLHAGVRAQHHPRRRRHVVAAVGGGAREARARLFASTPPCSPTSRPRSSPAASPPRTRRSPSRWM